MLVIYQIERQCKPKRCRRKFADTINNNHDLKESYIIKKLTIDQWSLENIAGRIKLKEH